MYPTLNEQMSRFKLKLRFLKSFIAQTNIDKVHLEGYELKIII